MGKRTVPMHVAMFEMNGQIHYAIGIAYDENLNAISKTTAKERINQIKTNIVKCGSYEKLREIGGVPTKNYLNSTSVILAQFFLEYVAANLVMDQAGLATLKELVRGIDFGALLKCSDWEVIEKLAEELRGEFTRFLSHLQQEGETNG